MRPAHAVALVVPAGLALFLAIANLSGCGGSGNTVTPPPPVTTTTTTQPPKPTGIVLPAGMVCNPTPPPLYRYNIHVWSGDCKPGSGCLLDTHPEVLNVDNYCERAGFGGYRFCQTRPEGDPQRDACNYMLTGQAKDTGKWGPTWYGDGRLCDGTSLTNCNNHDNQFKLKVKGPGEFMACVSDLVPISPQAELTGPNGRCAIINIEP